MANIPVEKTTTGFPWWLILLGLLLLAGLLWFLFVSGDEAEPIADADPIEIVDGGAVAGVTETALDLGNLYVTRVTGDRTFFVAPSEAMASDETLVILDQEMSPGVAGIEGQVDINPGQIISLTGANVGPLGDMDLANMGIPDADLNAMTATTDVIRADGDQVEIRSADMDNVEVGE